PGTVIHTSGDDFTCARPGEAVHVEVFSPEEASVASADTTVVPNGTWAVDVTIPGDAAAGQYTVRVDCTDGESHSSYPDQTFTVTAPPTTTTVAPTTSTTVGVEATTTSTVPPTVTVVGVPAPPATPVVASATLTG